MSKQDSFPGFKQCMKMMASRNPQISEDGFHALLPHAHQYVNQLIDAYNSGNSDVTEFWLLELIVETKSPETLPFLLQMLRHKDNYFRKLAAKGIKQLNTKEARQGLWEARANIVFETPEETQEFQQMVDAIMGWHTS